MKKFYFLLVLLPTLALAQLSENFDSSATLPGFWATFRGENGLGTAQDWGISTVRSFSPTNSAFVRYEATSGLNEDWLVTSAVDLSLYSGNMLSFYGGQQFTIDYGTEYTVRISTTSQTDIASFTTVATYFEFDFTDVTIPALTSMKTVDLSAYDGMPEVYIAFVMTQDDGDNWFLDDVNVVGTLGTKAFDRKSMVALYPNPSSGIVNVSTDLNVDKIEIFSLIGQQVQLVQGNSFDVSSLAAGTYMVKVTTTDGGVFNDKLIRN